MSIEDDDTFRFHRVECPVEVTQRKIRKVKSLDDYLANRLEQVETAPGPRK